MKMDAATFWGIFGRDTTFRDDVAWVMTAHEDARIGDAQVAGHDSNELSSVQFPDIVAYWRYVRQQQMLLAFRWDLWAAAPLALRWLPRSTASTIPVATAIWSIDSSVHTLTLSKIRTISPID